MRSQRTPAPRGVKREVGTFLLLSAVSLALFGWSTLGWLSQDTPRPDPFAPGSGPASLIAYSNDEDALTVADIGFFREPRSGLTHGWLDLKFQNVRDPENFRWALVGRGKMKFFVDQRLVPGGDDRLIAPKFEPLTASCTTSNKGSNEESVIFGGVSSSIELGTGLRQDTTGAEYVASLVFPQLSPTRSGEEYAYSLGALGRPTESARRTLASLSIAIYDECVDLTGLGNGVEGKLNANPADWTIEVEPHAEEDPTREYSPTVTATSPRVWRTSLLQEDTRVTFQDAGLARAHNAALFAAGILGGIAGGIASTWLTSGRQMRGERRAEDAAGGEILVGSRDAPPSSQTRPRRLKKPRGRH